MNQLGTGWTRPAGAGQGLRGGMPPKHRLSEEKECKTQKDRQFPLSLHSTSLVKGSSKVGTGYSSKLSNSETADTIFICSDCQASFNWKDSLTRHKKHWCPKTKGLDHLEATRRLHIAKGIIIPNKYDIDEKELNSTTYEVDHEIQSFLNTVPSAYAKFRLCENPKNPQPISGFWPALLDYRGKSALAGMETYICSSDGYKILANILRDAYVYHGVESIIYKKKAFVQTEIGEIYDVSDYRTPRTHCSIKKDAKVRLDQPKFKVEETDHQVTISFHEEYQKLLPRLILPSREFFSEDTEEIVMDVEEVKEDSEYLSLEDVFGSDTEQEFSQEFSQVSLEDTDNEIQSPISKKTKLSISTNIKTNNTDIPNAENNCPLCGVYISGNQGQINKHITKSCPNNPDIDMIEATRRRKRAEKAGKVKVETKIVVKPEPANKDKKAEIPRESMSPPQFSGGDCGCRGTQHQPGCLRLCGGATHV